MFHQNTDWTDQIQRHDNITTAYCQTDTRRVYVYNNEHIQLLPEIFRKQIVNTAFECFSLIFQRIMLA